MAAIRARTRLTPGSLEALAAARELGVDERVRRGPLGAVRPAHRLVRRGRLRDLPAPSRPRDRAVAPHAARRPALGTRAVRLVGGDVVGECAAAGGAGISVPIGDAAAAGDALVELLGSPERRARAGWRPHYRHNRKRS